MVRDKITLLHGLHIYVFDDICLLFNTNINNFVPILYMKLDFFYFYEL